MIGAYIYSWCNSVVKLKDSFQMFQLSSLFSWEMLELKKDIHRTLKIHFHHKISKAQHSKYFYNPRPSNRLWFGSRILNLNLFFLNQIRLLRKLSVKLSISLSQLVLERGLKRTTLDENSFMTASPLLRAKIVFLVLTRQDHDLSNKTLGDLLPPRAFL